MGLGSSNKIPVPSSLSLSLSLSEAQRVALFNFLSFLFFCLILKSFLFCYCPKISFFFLIQVREGVVEDRSARRGDLFGRGVCVGGTAAAVRSGSGALRAER